MIFRNSFANTHEWISIYWPLLQQADCRVFLLTFMLFSCRFDAGLMSAVMVISGVIGISWAAGASTRAGHLILSYDDPDGFYYDLCSASTWFDHLQSFSLLLPQTFNNNVR
jgi:hypothetical protein